MSDDQRLGLTITIIPLMKNMTKSISYEALGLYPELRSCSYSCHCSNVFQCNHPDRMIEDDEEIILHLLSRGDVKITGGDPMSYGSVLVRVPGTAGTLAKWV